MATQIPEAIRRIFTESFIARDIAEPLASFDAEASAAQVRQYMQAKGLDVVGIRNNGEIVGFVEKRSLDDGPCGRSQRLLSEARVLGEGASLLSVLREINHAPFLFVTVLGAVGGVITPADLQKPPVRMWVFGIVTLIEMRCLELIELLRNNIAHAQDLSKDDMETIVQLCDFVTRQ